MSEKLFTKAWRRKLKDELTNVGYIEGHWHPQLATIGTGTDIIFETPIGPSLVLSSNDHIATLTDPGTEGVSGGYFTNVVFPTPFTSKTGWAISLPEDPATKTNNTISLYLVMTNGTTFPPALALTAVIGVNDGDYLLYALGNSGTEDWNPDINLILTWSPTTIFTVAYDPTAGTYGTVHFYENDLLMYSYGLNAAVVGDVDKFAIFGGVTADSWSIKIENTPDVVIPGLTFAGGTSETFISNWPINRAGKAYGITGLGVEGLEIPGFDFVYNEDVVCFDLNSELTASL